MVKGMDKFREYFAGHENKYAVIGGAACELVFGDYGVFFRGSEDIDMVLCVDVVDAGFGEVFGKFLKDGGYQAKERQEDGKRQFYRFHKPTNDEFPVMIELFSRRDDALKLPDDVIVTRIAVEDNVISLSATLLNDTYYKELEKEKHQINGVTIIDQKLLIPFKALAYLNLIESEDARERRKTDIDKHLHDVFDLTELLPREGTVDVPEEMMNDIRRFLEVSEGSIDKGKLTATTPLEDLIKLLKSAYSL